MYVSTQQVHGETVLRRVGDLKCVAEKMEPQQTPRSPADQKPPTVRMSMRNVNQMKRKIILRTMKLIGIGRNR